MFGIDADTSNPRPWLAVVPADGPVLKLVHEIEAGVLDHVGGTTHRYASRSGFAELLSRLAPPGSVLAAQCSQTLPRLSTLDHGTAELVERLTNWYIRRSRRRFWKSVDDHHKAAAYATLYQVLATFVKALAPVLPFVTERIYQNLVRAADPGAPESIHLCDMPQAREELRDRALERRMELATRAVVLGRSLRSRRCRTAPPSRRRSPSTAWPPPSRSARRSGSTVISLSFQALEHCTVAVALHYTYPYS